MFRILFYLVVVPYLKISTEDLKEMFNIELMLDFNRMRRNQELNLNQWE